MRVDWAPCVKVRSAASETDNIAAAGGSGGRVEVLPVQWRKGLNLGVRMLLRRWFSIV
jgi:hypothetical protein